MGANNMVKKNELSNIKYSLYKYEFNLETGTTGFRKLEVGLKYLYKKF